MKTSTIPDNSKKILIKAGAVILWLLLWQLLSMLIGSAFLFPAPLTVFKRLGTLCTEKSFAEACLMSLFRISAGCIAGIVCGTFLGVVTSFSKILYEFFSPMLTVIKTTPVASFIILLLVWVKRDGITVIVSALLVTPILWANVSSALAGTDKQKLEMAKVFGISKSKKLKYIYIPSVMPSFAAGCKTAVGFSWKAGISAEVIANPAAAIGTNLYRAKLNLEYTDLFAWTLAVIILSLIVEKAFVFALGKTFSGRKTK